MTERTEIVSETRIEASPQRVWDLLGSTERYAEWVVNTLAVTRVDSPLANVGVTYDVQSPYRSRHSPGRRGKATHQDLEAEFEALIPLGAGRQWTSQRDEVRKACGRQ
jgi:uncharacterized protein YndB with AHSA1/START domain